MDDPRHCPVCDGPSDTKRVHTERGVDHVRDIYICEDCHSEYIVDFGFSHKEVTRNGEDEEPSVAGEG